MHSVRIEINQQKLEKQFQDLVDTNKEIPKSTRFIAIGLDVANVLKGGFYLFIVLAVIFIAGTINTGLKTLNKGEPVGIFISGIFIVLIFAYLAFRSYNSYIKAKKNLKLYQQGQYRKGIYLTENELVYFDGKNMSVFPSDKILELDVYEVGQKETKRKICELIYLDESNNKKYYELPIPKEKIHTVSSWIK